jgi:hypothetical protein
MRKKKEKGAGKKKKSLVERTYLEYISKTGDLSSLSLLRRSYERVGTGRSFRARKEEEEPKGNDKERG